MNSVVDLLDIINGERSPIEIRDNEAFSVPFITEHEGRKMLTLLCYSSQFSFGGSGSTRVNKVFYINPDDISDFTVEPVEPTVQKEEQLKLFSQNVDDSNAIPAGDRYRRLLDLTEIILDRKDIQKKTVLEYAELISGITNETLESYYLAYGHDYFMWLESFI